MVPQSAVPLCRSPLPCPACFNISFLLALTWSMQRACMHACMHAQCTWRAASRGSMHPAATCKCIAARARGTCERSACGGGWAEMPCEVRGVRRGGGGQRGHRVRVRVRVRSWGGPHPSECPCLRTHGCGGVRGQWRRRQWWRPQRRWRSGATAVRCLGRSTHLGCCCHRRLACHRRRRRPACHRHRRHRY